MHQRKLTICKYFTNEQHCPYAAIGYKFGHEPSHKGNIDKDTTANDDEDFNLSCEIVENQCHLCKWQLPNREDLFSHVESEHVEYHNEMMEIIATRRNTIQLNQL